MRFGAVAYPVDTRKGDQDLPLMLVSQYLGVQVRAQVTDDLARATDLSSYKVCRKGQIVLNRMSAYQGALGLVPTDGVVSPDYMVLQLRPGQDGRFWAYVMRSRRFVSEMGARVRGIGSPDARSVRTPRLGYSDLKLIDAPDVGFVEQRAIADYLDREVAQIDALIEKQLALIEILLERRAATITHVATRGLDPSIEMRPTGNKYVTSIPYHWTLSRFGLEVQINEGLVNPEERPWADMPMVAPNHIEKNTGKILARESAAEQGASSGKCRVTQGQIIYSKIRPALNKVALADEDCLISADMYGLTSRKRDDHRYLMYFMLSHPFLAFASEASARVKMPKINRDELSAAPWLRPPLHEQRDIAAHLDRETAKIDLLITKAKRFVELARERREGVITAAVTGQIDVRQEAVA